MTDCFALSDVLPHLPNPDHVGQPAYRALHTMLGEVIGDFDPVEDSIPQVQKQLLGVLNGVDEWSASLRGMLARLGVTDAPHKLHVAVISTPHGSNLCVAWDKSAFEHQLADYVAENLCELVDEEEAEVRALLLAGEYRQAAKRYFEVEGHGEFCEFFDVPAPQVYLTETPALDRLRDEAREAEAASQEDAAE